MQCHPFRILPCLNWGGGGGGGGIKIFLFQYINLDIYVEHKSVDHENHFWFPIVFMLL